MLRFIDGTQIAVNGLDEIMVHLYAEGRQANQATAEEILEELEAQKNYIPPSDRTRKEYTRVLLKEYKEYVESRTDRKE
jgi:hypothetical protein